MLLNADKTIEVQFIRSSNIWVIDFQPFDEDDMNHLVN